MTTVTAAKRPGTAGLADQDGVLPPLPVKLRRRPALVVAALALRDDLPGVMNVAQPGSVSMGALLNAAGLHWRFGPPRGGVVSKIRSQSMDSTACSSSAPFIPEA